MKRRLLASIPALFGVTVVIVLAMRVLPGDPLAMITGEGTSYILKEEDLQAARASLGLDKPLYEQYLRWMADVARGDLGNSFWRKEPIRDIILRRAPISGQIALMAIVISWLVGIPVGIVSAIWRNSVPDYVNPDLRHLLRGCTRLLGGAGGRAGGRADLHLPAANRPRLLLGRPADQPAAHAGPCLRAGRRRGGHHGAHDPLLEGRGAARGLRADSPGEGAAGDPGCVATRVAQCLAPRGHRLGAGAGRLARWLRRRRAGLSGAGPGDRPGLRRRGARLDDD